ncbi:hypothetical protein FFWV33_00800 [Flavobacterium faecale]|uniref:Uncharacterized protein n=1 Tax=Flavobacterium faecale TaxID=1355330 RepID=A0A2S1L8V6_9FLAO|nr:hypothetical protein FFWV33_00800 [Flavobacterium faecale]
MSKQSNKKVVIIKTVTTFLFNFKIKMSTKYKATATEEVYFIIPIAQACLQTINPHRAGL